MGDFKFQDRKLNQCAQCGTRKQLALHASTSGKLYFLCRGHTLILEAMEASIVRAAEQACLKKISRVHDC